MFGFLKNNKALENLVLGKLKEGIKEQGIKAIVIIPDENGDLLIKSFKNKIAIKEIEETNKIENNG